MKLTEEVTEKIANAIRDGCAIRVACILGGIAEKTYYNWHKKGKEILQKQDEDIELKMSTNEQAYLKFYIAVEMAHAEFSMELCDKLREKKCEQWQKVCWMLERRYPKEFGRFRKPLG